MISNCDSVTLDPIRLTRKHSSAASAIVRRAVGIVQSHGVLDATGSACRNGPGKELTAELCSERSSNPLYMGRVRTMHRLDESDSVDTTEENHQK